MTRKFKDYFGDTMEYPSPTESMLPLGTLYSYISTTFLNGWINYVDIVSAKLISRYTAHEKNLAAARALIDAQPTHVDFQESIDDDLLILAKGRGRRRYTGEWWHFWYNRDCSDSCIGRFSTNDTDADVVASFAAHADERSVNLGYEHSGHPAIDLPLRVFSRGWISG